ncbi:MAG: phosphodiester glycosidase family protein, partial [Polyangiaceae bacterium]|nr:phosphodiester glycosidase family protein [Polyangiaceae bacterium]
PVSVSAPAPASGSAPAPAAGSAPVSAAAPAPASAAGSAPCPGAPPAPDVAAGLLVERRPAALDPPVPIGDGCLTVVRLDPARYRPRLFTALPDGQSLPAPAWAARHGLSAVINASMYHPDLRSTGLLIAGGAVHSDRDNPRFGGFLAFDPVDPAAPPVAAFGRGCPGFDLPSIRRRYRSVVQNYRLLDCDGRPIAWRDEKVYSAAAIGLDRRGRVVLLHARTPTTMTRFAAAIAAPELGLSAAHYVEGGPEASLYVAAGGATLEQVGSYETAFHEADDNHRSWPIPNVLGFAPR